MTAPRSLKAHLIHSVIDWCIETNQTPYLSVFVTQAVQVPLRFVQDQHIVLNVSGHAVQGFQLTADALTFSAKFSGVSERIIVPLSHIQAVFAKESGEGLPFAVNEAALLAAEAQASASLEESKDTPEPVKRSHLTMVK